MEAERQAGTPVTDDDNGERQEGVGPMQHTIWRARRWSTASAYLRPAMRRGNCRPLRGEAFHVVFEGKRAVGVAVRRLGRPTGIVRARREVVLAAGAINSPLLLLRSGIGDPGELAEAGVGARVPRRGVGRNLQDHLEVYVQRECLRPITFNGYGASARDDGRTGSKVRQEKQGRGGPERPAPASWKACGPPKAVPRIDSGRPMADGRRRGRRKAVAAKG